MTSENGVVATMPMAPAGYSGGGFGSGFGWGNDIWLIIIILFAFGGFGFGGGGYGNGANAASVMYPWMNNLNAMQTGFDTAALTSQLSGIQTSLTNGFANAEVSGCNRATDALIASYNNQIANMNQSFANQQALSTQLNGISSSLQNCCCENRANIADLKYSVATEGCADRNAISMALRDVLEANNASTQKLLDKMNQQELDAKNDRIQELQTQLNMASLAASQTQQTAQLIADNTAQTQYIVNRVAPYPIPAYIVSNPVTPVVSV